MFGCCKLRGDHWYFFFSELDPAAPIGFTKRSAVYLQQRKYVEALADLDRAIAVDSTFLQGYLNRGRLLRQMCRYALGDFNVNPLRDHSLFWYLECAFCLLLNLSLEKILLQIIVNTFNKAKYLMFTSFDEFIKFCHCC